MSKRNLNIMRLVVNRWVAAMAVALLWCMPMKAALTAGGEYYIWLNIYEKLLGSNEAGTGPALSTYGTKSDGYVFVAESTGESDYFYLKQKSSGKYLAASGSNAWSITLESKSTADRFRWKMTGADCYAYLTNKKNSSSYVGIDGAKKGSTYVSIYYNKRKSSHGQFSIIPATGSSWDDARQAYESSVYTNAQGVKEIDYCQLNNKTINRSDAVDIHITSNDNPILGSSSVNLGSDRTWLIFDNIVPSKVISTYLKNVTINGVTAQKDVNCRVAIYLNGAAVIPIPSVVMSCEGMAGSFTLTVGNHKDLSEIGQSNTMTSFTLRRGYMATVAAGTNGSDHSRVYVADHADLEVTLPEALAIRVSSVNLKRWQYLSKKGWGNTDGSSGGPGLRATWFWSWSAGYSSTTDMEYVPCRQHKYWPSVGEVNSKTATAAISINEPDHSEQHTSDKCSCGGILYEWDTYLLNKDLQAGGGRIGSPQTQKDEDFSYLKQYFKYVDENNNHTRCDIAVAHAYLPISSRSADDYAKHVTDVYWDLWDKTKRPVWLTEMEVGATWNDAKSVITSYEKAREYVQALLQRLEEAGYIERYAIYGTDWWQSYMYYEANPSKGLTPAGQVYRDHRSTFAYNAKYTKEPVWWRPVLKKPTVEYMVNPDEQTITFTIGNTNGDVAETITLEYKADGGSWQQIATFSDRNQLEGDFTYTKALEGEGGEYRVKTTTIFGGSETGDAVSGPVLADIEPLYYAIKNHPLGFERGEYAPYTNVDGAKAIAEANKITHSDGNLHSKMITACQNIDNATWTPNTVELDAVYDGQFANTAANSTSGNINLPGWTKVTGLRFLLKDISTDQGIAYTDGKAAVFAWGGTTLTYGEQDAYTLPMNKHSIYELTLKVSGWRDDDLPSKFSVTFDGETQEIKPSVKRINNTSENPFQTLTFNVTPTADNSILKLYADHHFTIADISLTRTAESETVSVGESGYATYVSGRDLDFSATAIKAYTAAVEGGFVVLTPINKVKAGTPVILYYKGGNKEEAIPYTTSADAATGNQLVAGEGKVVASDGGSGVVNCILNKVGGQIGFYRANGQVVAWNHAYLPVNTNAARLDIRFADETTGAALVKSEGVKSEQLFNLKGQRVSSPKGGVFIQNGKKVIKN